MRSHRELWLWLGGLFLTLFAFFTAIAISYFEKDSRYSLFWNPWLPLAMLWCLIAFAAFFAAAKSWAFPPIAPDRFPDVTVDILSTGSTDTEREGSAGLDVPAHLRTVHVRFANTDSERSAKLSVTMYVKLIAGSWGRAGEAVCPPPSWALPPSLGLSPLSMPVQLGPGEDSRGQLVFEVPGYYLDKLATPPAGRLEILDHVSGKQVSIPAELGHYDMTAMTATGGGAEILGPEFKAQREPHQDQQPDTALDQA